MDLWLFYSFIFYLTDVFKTLQFFIRNTSESINLPYLIKAKNLDITILNNLLWKHHDVTHFHVYTQFSFKLSMDSLLSMLNNGGNPLILNL